MPMNAPRKMFHRTLENYNLRHILFYKKSKIVWNVLVQFEKTLNGVSAAKEQEGNLYNMTRNV